MLEIEFHSDKCGCGRICQFTYLINKKKKFIYSKVGFNTKSLQFVAIPWRCLSLINEFHIFFFPELICTGFLFLGCFRTIYESEDTGDALGRTSSKLCRRVEQAVGEE